MSGIAKSSQAFRTIAEAADELDVPAHVLRFWEGKFTQLRPLKRAGGRRHYRPDDMALLRGIRALLQEDGYQLKGVQKILRDQGISWVRERGQTSAALDALEGGHSLEPTKSAPAPAAKPPLHERADPELTASSGPLFKETSAPSISPSAGVLLRQALVKLERARAALDKVAV